MTFTSPTNPALVVYLGPDTETDEFTRFRIHFNDHLMQGYGAIIDGVGNPIYLAIPQSDDDIPPVREFDDDFVRGLICPECLIPRDDGAAWVSCEECGRMYLMEVDRAAALNILTPGYKEDEDPAFGADAPDPEDAGKE